MGTLFRIILFIGFCLAPLVRASAWSASAFAEASVLASGRWVKVSVPSSGAYCIPSATLAEWGFSNPSDVRVYGYGARQIANALSQSEYTDDLPLAPQRLTDSGLVFYAQGSEWVETSPLGNPYKNSNIYSSEAYYFLSESGADISNHDISLPSTPLVLQHEVNEISPGEAGWLLVGESFKAKQSLDFTFQAPVSSGTAIVEIGIVSDTEIEADAIITINGIAFSSPLNYAAKANYIHGHYTLVAHKAAFDAPELKISVSVPDASVMQGCWLDYIAVSFDGVTEGLSLSHPTELPCPALVGEVPNQNLHALEPVDMAIFTLPLWKDQAERIAQLHRMQNKALKVAVIDVNEVYNEFASGCPDVSALRRCLKMLYDRGALKYALLMGRSTYDNRHLTSQFSSEEAPLTIPCWMGGERSAQLSDNTAFGTDDFIAMLADGSGTNMGLDDISIAVGRMPVRSAEEAKSAVDKLMQYSQRSPNGSWRSNMLVVADDGDNGIHATHAENFTEAALDDPFSPFLPTKVYVDAYDIVGGACRDGHDLMLRWLNAGIAWWIYCGHANNHSWTSEALLTYTDINKNLFLSRLPVLFASTCDFLRWDSSTLSGGEILFNNRYGGAIAIISATRPVYISSNGLLSAAFGRAIAKREADGGLMRLGDIYRIAKNDITSDDGLRQSNANRLRYVLMGDPAMEIATPSNLARIDSLGGQSIGTDEPIVLKALQQAPLGGCVTDPKGTLLTDFNGTVEVTIYDADATASTKGVREENVEINFDRHGEQLFYGTAAVSDGRFSVNVSLPQEIADNYRPATIVMSAYSPADNAAGIFRNFYVYGLDESALPDSVPPVIHSLFLNHESFKPGDFVSPAPMVMAIVSDDVALNLSTSGIGRRMTLTLDDTRTFTDVAQYFTPVEGKPEGVINYPLSNLTLGPHTLSLKIWDTAGNCSSKDISFNVAADLAPTIYEVHCEGGTAYTDANFYLTHDRPDQDLTVAISVYSISGRKVWEGSATGRSDRFSSVPVTWNLTTIDGRRAPQGVYVYQATVKEAGGTSYRTESQKMVITKF